MSKQEEIREGTDAAFKHFAELIRSKPKRLDTELVKNMRKEYLAYLDSEGVVIKAERELPKIHYGSYLSMKGGDKEIKGFELGLRRMKEEGYEAVKPLVKEIHKDKG